MYRMANFFISKNLSKAEKMPNYRQWKVSEADKRVEGALLVYIRAKGWFLDRVCQPGLRYCVLTKRGFLLIYMKNDKGFVLDMRRAFEVISLSDNVVLINSTCRRCRIKVRFSFGTVNIVLMNGKIDRWRDFLLNASNQPATVALANDLLALPPVVSTGAAAVAADSSPRPASDYALLDNARVSPSMVALKSFSSGGGSIKEKSEKDWAKVTPPKACDGQEASVTTAVDVSTCDDDYQCLSSRLSPDHDELLTAESSISGLFNYQSVRESRVPVGWLRRQLEHKIDITKRRPLFVASPTTPSAPQRPQPEPAGALDHIDRSAEQPQLPLTVVKPPAPAMKVKFFGKKRLTTSAVKSVPNNANCDEFNAFQFWRSPIFESDV